MSVALHGVDLGEVIQEYGLAPQAIEHLKEATERGEITIGQLGQCFLLETIKNPVALQRGMAWIRSLCKQLGIAIVTSYSTAHDADSEIRAAAPIARTEKTKTEDSAPPIATTRYEASYSIQHDDLLEEDADHDQRRSRYADEYSSAAIFFRDVRQYPLLGQQEMRDLVRQYQKTGDLAIRDKLINSNLRLVASVAKRYIGRGLPYEDLIQEGALGLANALQEGHFDPDRGFNLSTYATWWIRQAITRALHDSSHIIRAPVHKHELWSKIFRAGIHLRQRLRRKPTVEEIAQYLDVPVAKIHKNLRDFKTQHARSFTDLEFEFGHNVKHGNDPVDLAHSHIFRDSSGLTPESMAIARSQAHAWARELNQFLRSLDAQSRKKLEVIAIRYGLNDDFSVTTLEGAATFFGITRERVRQICENPTGRLARRLYKPDPATWLESRANGIRVVLEMTDLKPDALWPTIFEGIEMPRRRARKTKA